MRGIVRWALVSAWAWTLGCTRGAVDLEPPRHGPDRPTIPTGTTSPGPLRPTILYQEPPALAGIRDLAVPSGYVDAFFGLQRGRAAVSLDVDGDGDFDTFVGSPLGTSYILENLTRAGVMRFAPGQVLATGVGMWGGAANDVDNDGDPDLYVTVGGNEKATPGLDHFYENVDGVLVDRSEAANVWQRDAEGNPYVAWHAGAFYWDMDLDGRLDVFTNAAVIPLSLVGTLDETEPQGLNGWLHNEGDGTFTDWREALGMNKQWQTRSSTWLDIDNDGDFDLFENNFQGPNHLWRNDGRPGEMPVFTDVTDAWSLGGADMSFPRDASSQAAVPADLNQDGWEDLVVFRRKDVEPEEPSVHSTGHLVWINMEGRGFAEVGDYTGINADFGLQRDHLNIGVMGCQLGDLTGDGIADLFSGNGNPSSGERNDLMVSFGLGSLELPDVGTVIVPLYTSWSRHIDFPSAFPGDDVNPYPYRTHGSYFGDLDGDGLYELAEHNGGTSSDLGVEEPNRLYKVDWEVRPHWLRWILQGDGVRVNRDGIGARVRVLARRPDGETRWAYATKRSATGFGAQNDPDVFVGLGTADEVLEAWVEWPGGWVQPVEVDGVDQWVHVVMDVNATRGL